MAKGGQGPPAPGREVEARRVAQLGSAHRRFPWRFPRGKVGARGAAWQAAIGAAGSSLRILKRPDRRPTPARPIHRPRGGCRALDRPGRRRGSLGGAGHAGPDPDLAQRGARPGGGAHGRRRRPREALPVLRARGPHPGPPPPAGRHQGRDPPPGPRPPPPPGARLARYPGGGRGARPAPGGGRADRPGRGRAEPARRDLRDRAAHHLARPARHRGLRAGGPRGPPGRARGHLRAALQGRGRAGRG